MIGCSRTRVRKQPIILLYFESENELKLYNLEARPPDQRTLLLLKNDLGSHTLLVLSLVLKKNSLSETDFGCSKHVKHARIQKVFPEGV